MKLYVPPPFTDGVKGRRIRSDGFEEKVKSGCVVLGNRNIFDFLGNIEKRMESELGEVEETM